MSELKSIDEIKKYIEGSYQYFSKNYESFYKFKKFIFKTSLSSKDITTLEDLGKPTIEFNTLEAYISRMIGEFATQEPTIKATIRDSVPLQDITENLIEQRKVIEGHAKFAVNAAANDNLQVSIYNDQLGGGFSAMRVYTDYVHSRSFEQKVFIDKPFDPTLCGFDPLARESHKGDGEYCFEISPYTKEYFIAEFGKEKLEGIKFRNSKAVGSFNWSYKSEDREILLVVDFFIKTRKTRKLVMLADGSVMYEYKYNRKVKEYEDSAFTMAVPPIVVERRSSYEEVIELYRVCENKILDHYETDYKLLPIIFVDGNSVMLRESTSGDAYQFTRAYPYHAEGIQRLRNFAGQTIGQQIENLLQHKLTVPIEAIPKAYEDKYNDIQHAGTLAYHQFYEGDPNTRLDPPRELTQTPIPSIVQETFMGADRMTQSILGNYDAVLGIGQKDISGKAIMAGAVQSSMASDPYLVNYMRALNRAIEVMVDLIPKYYKTPRSIPIIDDEGNQTYQLINMEPEMVPEGFNAVSMDYDSDFFEISVEAGVNTAVEKQISMELITKMMASSELFNNFMNAKGLNVILDNLEVRGIDQLKLAAKEYMEDIQDAQEAQAEQPTPVEIEAQTLKEIEGLKAQIKEQQMQIDLAVKTADLSIQKQKADTEQMKAEAEVFNRSAETMAEIQRTDAELAKESVEMLKAVTEEQIEEKKEDFE